MRVSERDDETSRTDAERDATPRATGVGFRPGHRVVVGQCRVAVPPGLNCWTPCLYNDGTTHTRRRDEAVSRRRRARRRGGRRRRRLRRYRRRRVPRPRRPLRLWQVDDSPDGRRTGVGDHGRGSYRRTRRHRPGGEEPRHRDGVPVLRALPAHDRPAEHGVRAGGVDRHARRRDRRDGGRDGGDARHRGPARPEAPGAVWRPAAAGRARACDRPRPGRVPDGRAAVEPGRQAPRSDANRAPAPPEGPRRDDGVRHARPDGGDDDGRPHRRPRRRAPPAGRDAPGVLPRAGKRVRRRLRRRPVDELRRLRGPGRPALGDGVRLPARRRPARGRPRRRPGHPRRPTGGRGAGGAGRRPDVRRGRRRGGADGRRERRPPDRRREDARRHRAGDAPGRSRDRGRRLAAARDGPPVRRPDGRGTAQPRRRRGRGRTRQSLNDSQPARHAPTGW